MKMFLILAIFIATSQVFACNEQGTEGILPKNDLYIPVGLKVNSNIDEQAFNDVIQRVEDIYTPIVESFDFKFKVRRKWSDGTVNAYAKQSKTVMEVVMFGGLARHETITKDGFALVLCHEIGHHLGGLPKKKLWGISLWASNEGQSDYWGTMKCLRKYFEQDNNVDVIRDVKIPSIATKKCSRLWRDDEDRAICLRSAMAGVSLGNMFATFKDVEVALDTPSKEKVTKTIDGHPAPQCRVDTYFQAGLCDKHHTEDIDWDNEDAALGLCSRTENYMLGTRPLCWYKPGKETEPT